MPCKPARRINTEKPIRTQTLITARLLMTIYLGVASQVNERGEPWFSPTLVTDLLLNGLRAEQQGRPGRIAVGAKLTYLTGDQPAIIDRTADRQAQLRGFVRVLIGRNERVYRCARLVRGFRTADIQFRSGHIMLRA